MMAFCVTTFGVFIVQAGLIDITTVMSFSVFISFLEFVSWHNSFLISIVSTAVYQR